MFHHYLSVLLILLLTLSGCSGLIQSGSGEAPVQDRGGAYGAGKPTPQGESGKRYQAVSGLVKQADQYAQKGQYARAAAFLERALRISPRDAWLWYKLAVIRMKQGYHVQAESMARKSLTMTGIPTSLKIGNWEVIRECAEMQGKQSTVLQARQKLLHLRQQED